MSISCVTVWNSWDCPDILESFFKLGKDVNPYCHAIMTENFCLSHTQVQSVMFTSLTFDGFEGSVVFCY